MPQKAHAAYSGADLPVALRGCVGRAITNGAAIGGGSAGGTPEPFAALIQSERERWGWLIDQPGIESWQ